jgi:hypothetical protein
MNTSTSKLHHELIQQHKLPTPERNSSNQSSPQFSRLLALQRQTTFQVLQPAYLGYFYERKFRHHKLSFIEYFSPPTVFSYSIPVVLVPRSLVSQADCDRSHLAHISPGTHLFWKVLVLGPAKKFNSFGGVLPSL